MPTDVPIEIDTNIQITNKPTIIKFCGISDKPKLTVDATPPIFSVVVEKAPAKIKRSIIKIILECPAFLVNTSIFFANRSLRFISSATTTVTVIATLSGMVVKSPEIIPTPKNNKTNNNSGNSAHA